MLTPLLLMAVAYLGLFLAITLIRMRLGLGRRRVSALMATRGHSPAPSVQSEGA